MFASSNNFQTNGAILKIQLEIMLML